MREFFINGLSKSFALTDYYLVYISILEMHIETLNNATMDASKTKRTNVKVEPKKTMVPLVSFVFDEV